MGSASVPMENLLTPDITDRSRSAGPISIRCIQGSTQLSISNSVVSNAAVSWIQISLTRNQSPQPQMGNLNEIMLIFFCPKENMKKTIRVPSWLLTNKIFFSHYLQPTFWIIAALLRLSVSTGILKSQSQARKTASLHWICKSTTYYCPRFAICKTTAVTSSWVAPETNLFDTKQSRSSRSA
mmetsp:Transcript_11467/g.16529  ORF Transcript_11467/g.16529 Transcript_11467/m.16529 type:complete len:182 (-) Transcript_11467:1084-1629(-)